MMTAAVGRAFLSVAVALLGSRLAAQGLAEAVEQSRQDVASATQALEQFDRAAACAAIARGLDALDKVDADAADRAACELRQALAAQASAAGSAPGAADLAVRAWRGAIRHLERNAQPDNQQFIALQEARGELLHALELQGDRKRAVELQRVRLAAALRYFPDRLDPGIIHRDILVRVLLGAGELDAARQQMKELVAISPYFQKSEDPGRDADRLLAMRLAEGGQNAAALREYQTIWEGTRNDLGEDHRQTLQDLENVARVQKQLGRFEDAYRNMERIVAAYRKTRPGSVELYGALENFATFVGDQGVYHDPRLVAYFEEALAGFERLQRERAKAASEEQEAALRQEEVRRIETCRWELAQVWALDGHALRGRELAQQSLDRLGGMFGEDSLEAVDPRGILTMVIGDTGGSETAAEYTRKNLAILLVHHGPGHSRVQVARRKLGEYLRQGGKPDAAVDVLRDACEALQRLPEPPSGDLVHSRQQLALTLCEVGRAREAVAIMSAAVATGEGDQERRDKDVAQAYLAHCLWLAGDRDRAASEFEQYLPAARRLEDPIDYAALARSACCLYAADPATADKLAGGLVDLLDLGQDELAKVLTLPPREAIEQALLIDTLAEFVLSFAGQVEKGKQQALTERAFSLLETLRGVALQSAHVFALAADDPEVHKLRLEANLARAELQVLTRGDVSPAEAGPRAERVKEAARARDRKTFEALQLLLQKYGGRQQVVTVAALQQVLQEHEVVVCFRLWQQTKLAADQPLGVTRESRLLAQIVTKKKGLQQQDLGSAKAIEEQTHAWLTAIKGGAELHRGRTGTGTGVDPAVKLAETIWLPVAKAIKDAGIKANPMPVFHVCVDDALHAVPLEALPDVDGTPLLEKFTIHFENSLVDLVAPLPAAKGDGSLLVVGDVDYDLVGAPPPPAGEGAPRPPVERGSEGTRWDRLENTAAEIEAVKRAFGKRKEKPAGKVIDLVRDKATRSEFAVQAEGRQFLHVATHANFLRGKLVAQSALDDPVPGADQLESAVRGFAPMTLCYLVLAGANVGEPQQRAEALVTAEELAGYDLRQCELAVLSACSSAEGELRSGHGVQSLQMALHAAGARSVIATRWPVSDEYAKKMMELFYDELWVKKTRGKAAALQAAKKRLREQKGDAGAPMLRNWAAFVLTGDPK